MEKLYLGVAREVITPEIGGQLYGYRPYIMSESVEDDLTVTAFFFRQGETKALMISATVCLINTQLSDNVLEEIEKRFSIPKTNCLFSATHTHSGPNTAGAVGWGGIDQTYCDSLFVPQVLRAVEKAVQNPQPVKMAVTHGESQVGINRRQLADDGIVYLGQNKWGWYNPKMTIISFKNEQEQVVANMIHYGAHGTAAGSNHEISRDWSGVMIDAVEKESGAITAFFNGPEGDVGPRLTNGYTTGDITYVHALGAVAAEDAVKIYGTLPEYDEVALKAQSFVFGIPLKKRMDAETAAVMLEDYKDCTMNMEGLIRGHLESVLAAHRDGVEDKQAVCVPQTIIVLGDIVFVGFPYELFSEIGMRIDKAIDAKSILSLSNTNGSEGYFVTEEALRQGGYEVDYWRYVHEQMYCDNADIKIMQATVENIKKMLQ